MRRVIALLYPSYVRVETAMAVSAACDVDDDSRRWSGFPKAADFRGNLCSWIGYTRAAKLAERRGVDALVVAPHLSSSWSIRFLLAVCRRWAGINFKF